MTSSSSSGAPEFPPLIPVTPAGVDADALAAATAAVRLYCGWHIAPSVTETVTLDGPGGDVLMLPTLRLTDLSDVINDGATVVDPKWSRAGMVKHWRWSCEFRGVTVTMTHGYDVCPDDVRGVLMMMAGSGSGGLMQQSAGPFSITPGVSMQAGSVAVPMALRADLDKYRIPSQP